MTRAGAARGALAFAFVAPAVYLAQRLYERAADGAGDPLGVVREVHVAFYWRAIIALWLGVVVAALVGRFARPTLEGDAGRAPWLVALGATAGVALSALLFP